MLFKLVSHTTGKCQHILQYFLEPGDFRDDDIRMFFLFFSGCFFLEYARKSANCGKRVSYFVGYVLVSLPIAASFSA